MMFRFNFNAKAIVRLREDMGFDAESAWQREASPEWNGNDDDYSRRQSDELNGGYWPEGGQFNGVLFFEF